MVSVVIVKMNQSSLDFLALWEELARRGVSTQVTISWLVDACYSTCGETPKNPAVLKKFLGRHPVEKTIASALLESWIISKPDDPLRSFLHEALQLS